MISLLIGRTLHLSLRSRYLEPRRCTRYSSCATDAIPVCIQAMRTAESRPPDDRHVAMPASSQEAMLQAHRVTSMHLHHSSSFQGITPSNPLSTSRDKGASCSHEGTTASARALAMQCYAGLDSREDSHLNSTQTGDKDRESSRIRLLEGCSVLNSPSRSRSTEKLRQPHNARGWATDCCTSLAKSESHFGP